MDQLFYLLAGANPASRPGPGDAWHDDEEVRTLADDALRDIQVDALMAARRAGATWADADDAAQDTIIALWQAAARGGLPAEPSAYAKQIAKRRAMRYRSETAIPVDDNDLDTLASPAEW